MADLSIFSVIRRPDEKILEVDWPGVEPFIGLQLSSDDCLILAMGFEERCAGALSRFCSRGRGFNVIPIRYLPSIEENREDECRDLCRGADADVVELEYDRQNPSSMGLKLCEVANSFDRIFVDISSMSRLLIVQIVSAFVEAGAEFDVLYSEAEVYPPGQLDYQSAVNVSHSKPAFLSSGVFEIASCSELSSASMLGSAVRLVSFPSFDPSQLSNLVQEVQPSHNDVVHGIPLRTELSWRHQAIKELNQSVLGSLERVSFHKASTLDYRQTLKSIVSIYQQHSVFDRIVIAPTGSKMQAFAIGILRGILSDLQIVYPTPLEFLDPGHHTTGIREIYRVPVAAFS